MSWPEAGPVCFSHLQLLADKPGVKVLCGLGYMATVNAVLSKLVIYSTQIEARSA